MGIQDNYKKALIRATFLLSLLITFQTNWLSAQMANIQVTVQSGNSTTTCNDIFNAPEPRWGVNVNFIGYVTYPADGGCFNNTPNLHFNEAYECFPDAPKTLTICFDSFEDDGSNCNTNKKCREIICQDYAVPL